MCSWCLNFIISIFNNIITYIFIQPSPIYKRFKICRNGEYELTMGYKSRYERWWGWCSWLDLQDLIISSWIKNIIPWGNELGKKSWKYTLKGYISVNKMRKKKMKTILLNTYMRGKLIKMNLELFFLAWSFLESLNLVKIKMSLEVFLVFFERERESRRLDGEKKSGVVIL